MRLLGSFCVFLLLAFEPRLAHGQSLHGPVEVNTSVALAASLASPHTTSILLSGKWLAPVSRPELPVLTMTCFAPDPGKPVVLCSSSCEMI